MKENRENVSELPVLWRKVWSIAAIQGAITLSWIIYSMYLPKLLVELGFAVGLAKVLVILEHALEALIEPTFGAFSDKQQRLIGSRIPIISIGVILASAFFISLPVVAIFGNPNSISRWFLPVFAVLWAAAMAIFRSPTISLLKRSAPKDKLPQAASILTLVAGFIGAFRFDAYGIILSLGSGFAFFLGSVTLLLAMAALRFVQPPDPPAPETTEKTPISFQIMGLILATGISVGWGLRFLIPTISKGITLQLGESNTKLAMMGFFVALGLAALPAGKLATKLGNSKAMLIGLVATIFSLQLLVFIPNGFVTGIAIFVLVTGFSLVLNGAVSFVLGAVPEQLSGLGIGIYYGGFGGAISLFDFIFSKLGGIPFTMGAIGGGITFFSAAICIALSIRLARDSESNSQELII
ncbi:MAG: SLC45 family MFS transporter [Moorea sp. SIO2B7]|nr:SLC45 family MFS transporter [Moorena sp. SIO2B7]